MPIKILPIVLALPVICAENNFDHKEVNDNTRGDLERYTQEEGIFLLPHDVVSGCDGWNSFSYLVTKSAASLSTQANH